MQKVVCGVCGLTNLESFPTYPLCAGCGARLPPRERRPIHDFFARPVKTLVWALCVGVGVSMLALLSTGIARETRLRDRGALLVDSKSQPTLEDNGQRMLLLLTVRSSLPEDRESIRNLRLRFEKNAAREADVRVVSPPATVTERGKGRYFEWNSVAPGQTIKVSLRPRRGQTLHLDLAANGFTPYTLTLSPKKVARPPVI